MKLNTEMVIITICALLIGFAWGVMLTSHCT
jgi:hypothetical protein